MVLDYEKYDSAIEDLRSGSGGGGGGGGGFFNKKKKKMLILIYLPTDLSPTATQCECN